MKQAALTKVNMRIPEVLRKRMKELSVRTGIRLEKLYSDAVERFLAEQKKAA